MIYDIDDSFLRFRGKYVCPDCFEDYAISRFIKENTANEKCSYCGKNSQNDLIAADMNEVIEFILEGIGTEWGDPNDAGVSYITKEGGWFGVKVVDTYDLIHDEYILGEANEDIIDEIIDVLDPFRAWCQSDPHSLLPQIGLISTWEQFAYLDIETTGLDRHFNEITTIALYDGRAIKTYVKGQKLDNFIEDIQKYKVIVSYNGKSFDVPFIENYFNIRLDHAHIDLRYILHSLKFRGGLKGCERQLDMDRSDLRDIDGFFAVLLWDEYQKTGDQKALETMLAYNV
jgi:uncharacterized protein YprB with RNaseH-like and TPR domain